LNRLGIPFSLEAHAVGVGSENPEIVIGDFWDVKHVYSQEKRVIPHLGMITYIMLTKGYMKTYHFTGFYW
jgi:hypothetical protein